MNDQIRDDLSPTRFALVYDRREYDSARSENESSPTIMRCKNKKRACTLFVRSTGEITTRVFEQR